MGTPYAYAPPPPSRPPARGVDVGVSITLLVLTLIGVVGGAFIGLFMLAFLDYCPPETCSTDGAVAAIFGGFGVATLVLLLGGVLAIVQMARRKLAWPVAAATLVLCTTACIGGYVGYFVAVG